MPLKNLTAKTQGNIMALLVSQKRQISFREVRAFPRYGGCAVVGVIDRSGKKMTGEGMIKAIEVMHDRSNGLGGGFAGYGIYPHYKDFYAFHLFFETQKAQEETEAFLKKHFEIVYASEIQTRKLSAVRTSPSSSAIFWRRSR